MKKKTIIQQRMQVLSIGITVLAVLIVSTAVPCEAATAKEIDLGVDVALERFEKDVRGAKEFMKSAKGLLVFPRVYKAGFGIGGEYGEGALRIGRKTVAYYNTAGASFGFQVGAQAKTLILVFMEKNALDQFQESAGWKVGVDGSVAVIDLGAGETLDSTTIKDPIVAFVFGNKGLMLNLTLEGSKFTKMEKKK